MITDKYEKILRRFKLYYPDYYNNAIDWWGSGRSSIGVKLMNSEMIEYDDMDNTIRWIKIGADADPEYRKRAFGYNLQKIIPSCGMSNNEIAEKLGITNAMLSRYLHGKTMPSFDKAFQLSRIIGCTMEELMDDSYLE